MAVKACHEIIPDAKIGCMILGMPVYPLKPSPEDMWETLNKERENFSFQIFKFAVIILIFKKIL